MGRFYVNRALIVIGLAFAFLVMASIFVPGRIRADEPHGREAGPVPVHPGAERLPELGHLEGDRYIVRIYGSAERPLFTVYAKNGSLLASRIDADEAAARFPDLRLPDARALRSMSAGVEPDW